MIMRQPIDEPTTTAVRVRQAGRQRLSLRVLLTSMLIITVLFAGLYLLFIANAPPSENVVTEPAAPVTAPAAP